MPELSRPESCLTDGVIVQKWALIGLAMLLVSQAHSQPPRPQPKPQQKGSAARKATGPPPLSLDEVAVDSSVQPQINKDDTGSAVLRAQILLARAHFSCGEIDARFGTNLQTTVRAYQQEHNLPVSGSVDDATWKLLNQDLVVPITAFTITPEDETGPFVNIPADMMQQAKLPALGFRSPLEEFAERYHSSTEVLRLLNPGADFSRPGQELKAPDVRVAAPGTAARVVVSKGESSVRVYDDKGKLLAFYMATTGSEHDPLPLGDWKITWVGWNPKFHYNPKLFWDAKKTDDPATIKPGPNNPVGVVWINLSKEHYGIHGTPDPGKVGHAFSHGCIRLTNWDATELGEMVKPGTPATLKE